MHCGFLLPWMPLLAIAGIVACGVPSSSGNRIDAVEHTVMAEGPRTTTVQTRLTASDGEPEDIFGWSVAISGDTAVAGAIGDDDKGTLSGSAYAFVRIGDVWAQQQKLTASDGAEGDGLGQSIALAGDTAVVGAVPNFHEYWDRGDPGAAYVFVRSGGVWAEQQKLTASDKAANDVFGWSVAVEGDTAVVGAPFADTTGMNAGAVYVFTRSGATWTEAQKLTASDGAVNDLFGWSVSMAGDTVVIGAPYGAEEKRGERSGAAYVFVRKGVAWTEQARLTAKDRAEGDAFGVSVAVADDTVVVGAHGDASEAVDSGSAHIFVRGGDVWTEAQKLTASERAAKVDFGFSVAVSGGTAVVGALGELDPGAVYVFVPVGGVWAEHQKLMASHSGGDGHFGLSVAISADTVVAGAPFEDGFGEAEGGVYVVRLLDGRGSTRDGPASLEAASAENCTYYRDATYTQVVGKRGYDCCNNYIDWGTETDFSRCSNACFVCQPPPP